MINMEFIIRLLVFIVCVSGLLLMWRGAKNNNDALEAFGVFMEMLGLSLVVVYSMQV